MRRYVHALIPLGFLLALALSPPAHASGPAFLVKDINTEVLEDRVSKPSDLTAVGNTVYFAAETRETGRELWKSDGTEGGTALVRDISGVPSPSGGLAAHPHLTNVNGTLFFIADDGIHGAELWKSDGTEAGTVLVKDLFSFSSDDGMFYDLVAVNGTLFFSTLVGVTGTLWRSDGTAAGTVSVKQIDASKLTNVNGTLFFVTYDGSSVGLWKSNGTGSGTVLVKQFHSSAPSQSLANLTNVNGNLFLTVEDGNSGVELWKSNGTAAGTVRVKDINPGAASAFASGFEANLTNVDGTLFFAADDGQNGVELWKSDGTAAGTVQVKNIAAGTVSAKPKALTNVQGMLFFGAEQGDGVDRLWKSDGTEGGTVLVKDIVLSLNQYAPPELINVNGTLFFKGNDLSTGFELWKSDGTVAGTVLVKNIALHDQSSFPMHLTYANGQLFFVITNNDGSQELWRSDGTAAGTQSLQHIRRGTAASYPTWLTEVSGTLFFTTSGGGDTTGLWKSDGTTAGTVAVQPGGCLEPSWLTNFNEVLFFACGTALHKSDGTAAGTVLVKDTPASADGSGIVSLRNVNGTLFFAANTGSGGRGVWRSDGTPSGTVPAAEINGASYGIVAELGDANGTLFFTTGDYWGARHLWKSDGTAAGTTLLKSFLAPPDKYPPSSILHMTSVSGTLFFSAYDSASGYELWKSDGTPAGTVRVKDINPGLNDSNPASLVSFKGALFFSADDGGSGRELWRSDGTAIGTVRVVDLLPGVGGSDPTSLANIQGKLLFTANDRERGYELWQSDGTAAGTGLLLDIVPGSAGSWPGQFTVASGYLFFSADDGSTGQELWALSPGVDTYLRPVSWSGAAPGGMASLPVRYGNQGLTSASGLTLTATLNSALRYVDDTSGITPAVNGQTITWHLPASGAVSESGFVLRVSAPNAPLGTSYPVTLTLTASAESHPADNTALIEVMIARQVFLPTVAR
jgi:ELWxxDGT repeat protein